MAAMGDLIAMGDQVMVPLAVEQLYAVHSREVTELLPVMQAWRIVDALTREATATNAQSSKRLPETISQAPAEASAPAHRGSDASCVEQ